MSAIAVIFFVVHALKRAPALGLIALVGTAVMGDVALSRAAWHRGLPWHQQIAVRAVHAGVLLAALVGVLLLRLV